METTKESSDSEARPHSSLIDEIRQNLKARNFVPSTTLRQINSGDEHYRSEDPRSVANVSSQDASPTLSGDHMFGTPPDNVDPEFSDNRNTPCHSRENKEAHTNSGQVGKNVETLLRINQELIALTSILEEARSKAMEEANRMREQKENLEIMLQKSSNREQFNLTEMQKQRGFLVHLQDKYVKLKEHAMNSLAELESTRNELQENWSKTALESEHYRAELQNMEKERELEQAEYSNMKELNQAYQELSEGKELLQREIEALRHDNFKLQNSVNQLSTENNQLLSRVDELTSHTAGLPDDLAKGRLHDDTPLGSPLNLSHTTPQALVPSDDDNETVKSFKLQSDETKVSHFEELLHRFRKEEIERKKMEKYAYALLHEVERIEAARSDSRDMKPSHF